jgi:Predicted integral membrane protein (DUF2269)
MGKWIVLLHVAVAFTFVAGIIGRDMTIHKARTSTDVRVIGDLMELAGRFETWLIRPGSLAVLLAGIWAALARGLSFTASGNRWLLVSLIVYLSTVPFIPLVFIPRGKVFGQALAAANERGEVTPELTAAFHDPAVAFARNYELVVIAVIVTLMVTKPF